MDFIIRIILLDITQPSLTFWLGVVVSVMLGLVGFLTRDAYARLTKRLDLLEDNQAKDRKELEEKINGLHFNILNKLDEIKDKFNDLRKQ